MKGAKIKGNFALTIFITLFITILISGCRKPVEVELPPHEFSYVPEITENVGEEEMHFPRLSSPSLEEDAHIMILNKIGVDEYPHLSLREGFILYRTRIAEFGSPVFFVVAVHEASQKGFAVEYLNDVHGKFLFATIESADDALEYAKFMTYETVTSGQERWGLTFIDSQDDFERAFREIEEEVAAASISTKDVMHTPRPTTMSRVADSGPNWYFVELLYEYKCPWHWIDYYAIFVTDDGDLTIKQRYPYISGVPCGVIIE